MAGAEQASRIVRFEKFELNLTEGELRKNGTRIRLQDQPFQVLAALLERPGKLVAREALRERLWSGDTFVDFDRSLNTAIAKIREALGDAANEPRFIETLPRRGYRFIGAVERLDEAGEIVGLPAGSAAERTISHYRLLEKLGEGGMGVVYKAEDTKLKRNVALKFLAPHLTQDPKARERFLREAQAAAAVDHPNICTVYEIDEAGEQIFIAMAYVEGQSLEKKTEAGPFEIAEALEVAMQVAQGLGAAHEAGVVHRDIKSANLMLTPQSQVKIMDFGLAQLVNRTRLTQTGTSLGTPACMSPEQARRQPTDHRTDVWSLGAVIYEMVTGRLPFEGEREEAVLHAIVHEDAKPMTGLRVGVPIDLDRLVGKAMAKSPDERYQHVDEMLVDLRALKGQLGDVGARHDAPAPSPTPPRTSRISRIAPWALLAVAAAIIVALGLRGPGQTREKRLQRFAFMPRENAISATISPDGNHIAYIVGNGGLWIQDLDQQEPRKIAGGAHPFWAACWSPDSQFLAYRAAGDLKKVSVQGGAAATLCQMPDPHFMGCSWEPKGGSIVFSSGAQAFYEVAARGGSPKVLVEPDEPAREFIWGPHFLPLDVASRGLLFGVGTVSLSRIVLQDLITGERVVPAEAATAVFSPSGHILYQPAFSDTSPLFALPFSVERLTAKGGAFPLVKNARTPSVSADGTLVYVETGAAQQQLVWRDRDGRKLGEIGEPQENMVTPALSPDGRFVAVSTAQSTSAMSGGGDIWIHDVAHSRSTRFTFDPALDFQPIWSADGKEIAISSTRAGSNDVFIKRTNGSGAAKILLATARLEHPEHWSPDGRYITIKAYDPETNADLWYLERLEGGNWSEPTVYLEPVFDQIGSQFSPDSRYLAYCSEESGRFEVYVRPFPHPDGIWQISSNGGGQPRWNKDGTELFYVEGDTLIAVEVTTRPTFSFGSAKRLFSSPSLVEQWPHPAYDVSADGERFVLIEPVGGPQPAAIRVVQNWYEEFRDRGQD